MNSPGDDGPTQGRTSSTADRAATEYADAGRVRFAFRRMGTGRRVPLILHTRFRGTIDHWDPFFLEALATHHDVVIFDNAGVNLSTGEVPETIEEMAADLLLFIDALGLTEVDLLGWSMGGFVVQAATLTRPGLVRRLVVAGSGPGAVPGTPPRADDIPAVANKAVNDDSDFLRMFFTDTETSRQLGLESLRRLDTRLGSSGASVNATGVKAQATAMAHWTSSPESAWDRLEELALPVLVANGAHDAMIPAFQSYAMSQRLPNAKLVLYSDAGHAFLFQHAAGFASEIRGFLSEAADRLS